MAAVSIAQRVYVQLSSRKAAMGGGVQHGAAAASSEQRAGAGKLAAYDRWTQRRAHSVSPKVKVN